MALPSSPQSLQPFLAQLLCPWGMQCGNAPGHGASRAKVLHCHPRPCLGIQSPTLSLICLLIHNRKESISQASAHRPNRNVRPAAVSDLETIWGSVRSTYRWGHGPFIHWFSKHSCTRALCWLWPKQQGAGLEPPCS